MLTTLKRILILLALFSATIAQAHSLNLRVGEPILEARSAILKNGWKPDLSHIHKPHFGTDNVLIKHKIREVEACSVDNGSLCILNYKKQGKCLKVFTKGEQIHDMLVEDWNFGCDVSQK